MSLCSIAISGYMVITALSWPLMAALFPVVMGTLVFLMAISDLYFSLFGKEDYGKEESSVDFQLSESTDQALANRRTISIFLWMVGFLLLIVLAGFSVAIPLFLFLFLKLKGRKGWKISLGMAVLGWASFFALFVWLLHTPFQEGWLEKGLRAFGIL